MRKTKTTKTNFFIFQVMVVFVYKWGSAKFGYVRMYRYTWLLTIVAFLLWPVVVLKKIFFGFCFVFFPRN